MSAMAKERPVKGSGGLGRQELERLDETPEILLDGTLQPPGLDDDTGEAQPEKNP